MGRLRLRGSLLLSRERQDRDAPMFRLLPLVALPFVVAFAADPPREPVWTPPKAYVCYRAGSPITIDGKLDDAAWRDAPWTDDFVDIEGSRQPAPALRTRAKMLWDNQYLYIGADLVEPALWGTMKEHASLR